MPLDPRPSSELQARYEREVARRWERVDGAHDLQHLRRVWAACRTILQDEPGADAGVVMAGAFFHDAVNLPKDDPDRHLASRRSAELAGSVLAELGFPTDRLEAVRHAIAASSFSAGVAPETIEAEILQDADRLDALGAVGLARLFYTAGVMRSDLVDPADPLAAARPLDDRRFALDHIEVKLLPISRTMRTARGRSMAEERAAWLVSFRERFLGEAG